MRTTTLAAILAAASLALPLTAGASHDCFDAIDNDGDGFIDASDPGCADGPPPIGDGLETSPDLPCDDGIDNDGDGFIDSGVGPTKDPGCRDPEWPLEDPFCNDGVDSERQSDFAPGGGEPCLTGVPGDGFIDYPDDLGCSAAWDLTETDPAYVCDDGIDNDFDNSIDFGGGLEIWPNGNCYRQPDGGCESPWADTTEQIDPTGDEACSNDIDDDGDGMIDLADPGCHGAFDDDERLGTACDNGFDEDADGLTDFPDDPDCDSPEDGSERPPGVSVPLLGAGGLALLILSLSGVALLALRRGLPTLTLFGAGLVLAGLLLGQAAEARTLSSVGVLCAHATNELLTAPMGYAEELDPERSWSGIRSRWFRWPMLPFLGTARALSHVGAWLVTGVGAVPLEVFTYRYREGSGMIAPIHPDPHYTFVLESSLLPTCDWPWADQAPDCIPVKGTWHPLSAQAETPPEPEPVSLPIELEPVEFPEPAPVLEPIEEAPETELETEPAPETSPAPEVSPPVEETPENRPENT